MTNLRNIHPGEILQEEFLKPMGVSQTKAAHDMGVSARRINEIVLQKRSITADTALRLALYFRTTEYFWIGLQDDYNLEEVRRTAGERIRASVKPLDVCTN
ncbi:MAG: HigA family addiction module antidote protein [Alphaproteobacteria bacterium]|jgi:antitoxin HigA-1|nr:HigA family addiction module antidote protein [Alphaproteobacteria bacterium]MBT5389288.1 HigA family addiction module antidote protein [Alphaproteobacteria bacterium]MBT5540585.1 HigA family addiction module antidote protein [Alphaproteobacteria bacterium]